MPESEPPLKPWQWPRQWIREESFWREVATRSAAATIAALIVIFLGYLYAVTTGYLEGPNVTRRWQLLAIGLVLVGIIVVGAWINLASAKEMQRREGGKAFWRYFTGVGIVMLAGIAIPVWFYVASIIQVLSETGLPPDAG